MQLFLGAWRRGAGAGGGCNGGTETTQTLQVEENFGAVGVRIALLGTVAGSEMCCCRRGRPVERWCRWDMAM
jgi:hypothetical protein